MRGGQNRKEIQYIINENGCHICTSHATDTSGYPVIMRNKKLYHISRYLWEQKYGPIPEKMEVCHKCNTPACINVDHLELDTHQKNIDYKVACNRQLKGENIPIHKLTEKQVLQIRKEIGNKYGIDHSTVNRIKSKKIWKHLL